MRRLAVLFTATLLLTVVVAIPASADHLDYSFEVDVDGTATLNQFRTVLTVTGTYTCLAPGFDENNSGFGGSVFQSQKGGKFVVQGGLGFGGEENPLLCNGVEQEWSSEVHANFDDDPAVWKRGRVIVSGGGNVCDADCTHEAGDGFTRSVKITR